MRAARIAGILSIAAVAAFVAARWLWPDRSAAPLGHEVPATAPAPSPAPEAPAAEPAAAELRVEPGATLQIDAASLPSDRPVVLWLALGEPSRTDEPRPVRIAAVDGRVLDAQGRLGGDGRDARLELDPAFLTPGRYLVEVKTTEMSPFPLRRYVLEVR